MCSLSLRQPVLHVVKCEELEDCWINLTAFNRDIISGSAHSAGKCLELAKPLEDRAAIFCQSVGSVASLTLSGRLRAKDVHTHAHSFSIISYLHERNSY